MVGLLIPVRYWTPACAGVTSNEEASDGIKILDFRLRGSDGG